MTRAAGSIGLPIPLLVASGVLAAIAIAFLIAMFVSFAAGATAAGQALGRVNDILIMVAYPLAIPGILGVRALLRSHAPVGSAFTASLGRPAASPTPRRALIRPMSRPRSAADAGQVSPGAVGWLSSTRAVSVQIREE